MTVARLKPPEPPGRKPPATISATAADWWRSVTTEFEIQDAPGLMLLEQACHALDRIAQAQVLIKKRGIVVEGAGGRLQQNPAVTIERDARAQFIACVRGLHLEIAEPNPIGRPPGGVYKGGRPS